MVIDKSKLRGQYVYLDELREEHIPALKLLARDPRLWEYTKSLLVNETFDSQFERYIQTALTSNGDSIFSVGLQKTFVIHNTDSNIIGMTRYYGLEEKQKRVDIGYTWYIPEVWGKVHNKECKLLLLQYAFEELKLNRVGFHVAHINLRSQKAVEKIGGIKEGVLRKHSYQPDGSIRHTVLYSILDEEWPEVKVRLLKLVAETDKD
ncbi:MAG TPA: GNAT family protein [Chitinophagaceae bacterium]|jgi:RimJ/RimL family protein N-acetyltransferase|nr:GNAT family protein [Chitinophagaceae bacterium]